VGGLVNTSGSVKGAQIAGFINVAGDVYGTQIGAVNVARHARGAQIGAVNVGDEDTVQIGAVSIARGGRTHLQVWGTESGLLLGALEHGSRYVHNLYGAGARLVDGRFVTAFGIGAHAPLTDRVRIDTDLLYYLVFPVHFTDAPTQFEQLRVTLGVRVIDRLTLFAGPTFNVAHDDNVPTRADFSPYKAFVESTYRFWPGATLGVEAF
jgi:hypothetical protein